MRALLLSSILALGGAAPAIGQNFIVVLLDDFGVDRMAAYGAHPQPGRTPVLDAFAAQGMLFRNA